MLRTEYPADAQPEAQISPVDISMLETFADPAAKSEVLSPYGELKRQALNLYVTTYSDLPPLHEIDLNGGIESLAATAKPYEEWVPEVRDTLAAYAAHPKLLARDVANRRMDLTQDTSGGTSKEYWANRSFVEFFQNFDGKTMRHGRPMKLQDDGAEAFDTIARLLHGKDAWQRYMNRSRHSFRTRSSERTPVTLTQEDSTRLGEYTRELRLRSVTAIPRDTPSLLDAKETAKAGIFQGGELRFALQFNDHDHPASFGVVEITDRDARKAANDARYAVVRLGDGDGKLDSRTIHADALDGGRRSGAISIRRKRFYHSLPDLECGETAVRVAWNVTDDMVVEFEPSDNGVSVSLQAASRMIAAEKGQRVVGKHRKPSRSRQLGQRVLAKVT
jgi:hypothetical protein